MWLDHRIDDVFVADSLNWSWFESSRIKFDDTDYFDSTDSRAFWERRGLWFSSNQWSYVFVDSIDRVNRCYWMSDRFSSNSTVLPLILLTLWCCSVFRCRRSSGKQISLYLFRCSSSVLNEYWYSYRRINEFLV